MRPTSRLCRIAELFAALLVLAFATGAAQVAQAADALDFQLDFDTGGHRAFIKDLAFSPDGQSLVSASDDKTVRIWDWQAGVTLKTLRGYAGQANDGKVFAVALSPDGKTVATGGYFGKGPGDQPPYGGVRIFDYATGRVKAVLPGNELAVYAVSFSPDGTRLAAAGQDGYVYIWRAEPSAPSGWAEETRLDADSVHVQKIAFALDGARIVATTTDNGIRLFEVTSGDEIVLAPESIPLHDVAVMALAVSPDGTRFATGSADGQVDVFNADDGALVAAAPILDFHVGALTFAGNERLVIACGYRCGAEHRTLAWTVGGTAAPAPLHSGHDGTVFAAATSPDGKLVATAGGTRNEIQVFDAATGEALKVLKGLGDPVTAVGISADGSEIAWGTTNPCPERFACPEIMGSLTQRLALPTVDRFFERPEPVAENQQAVIGRAALSSGKWKLTAMQGGPDELDNAALAISLDGRPVQTITRDATSGYLHSAFTLVENGLRFISGGSDGTLIEYFSATGRQAGEFRDGHTGEINAIATSESANLLVTGSADQTLRLWNLQTRELIVSMLFAGKDWVVWMPQGYYYASDEGDRLIGWHVNQGLEKEGRFVRAAQLKKYLWSPEMVRKAIILRSAAKAVAEMRPGADKELERLLQKKPPEFDVRLANDQTGARDGFVRIEVTGAEEADANVANFAILANSRNVGDLVTRSVERPEGKTIIEVPVEAGENAIRITGTNEFGYVTERSVVALAKARAAPKKGKLYVAVIGVEKYPLLGEACNGRSCDLKFPVDDAAAFLDVVAKKTAPLFSGMETLVLLNRESLDETPDERSAVDGLVGEDKVLEPDSDTVSDQLEDFLDRPGPDDTTILFVAGHGVNVDEDYYFIPTDGRRQDGDKWKRSSLVDWGDIQEAMERAKGVRFMLLDTCHAANAFNPRLEKDAADARIVVFSATAANNTALELAELGHGVFTYSVLAGLRGEAKTSKDGVTLFGLADYISRQIVELTGARQKPFYYVSGIDNMLLAQP